MFRDTSSTGIYKESSKNVNFHPQIPNKPDIMLIKRVTNSKEIRVEVAPHNECENEVAIHIDPVKKFKVNARVTSIKPGTVKNIDKTTIIL
jgi:hypothetical protein